MKPGSRFWPVAEEREEEILDENPFWGLPACFACSALNATLRAGRKDNPTKAASHGSRHGS